MVTEIKETAAGITVSRHPAKKLAFHGSVPAVQRSGAAQAAVATAALSVGATFDQTEVTALATRCAALTALVNELRAALVEKGLIKGAA